MDVNILFISKSKPDFRQAGVNQNSKKVPIFSTKIGNLFAKCFTVESRICSNTSKVKIQSALLRYVQSAQSPDQIWKIR